MLDMHMVDCGADGFGGFESMGIFFAARDQPFNQIGNGPHSSGQSHILLRLANPLPHPGKINQTHHYSSATCLKLERI